MPINQLHRDLKVRILTSCSCAHLGVNKTDIMTVSKWMGHRDPRVTLSTYAKVIEELEKEHQDAIGNALVPIAD